MPLLRQIVRHLAERGHRRFLFRHVDRPDNLTDARRRAAALAEARRLGIELLPSPFAYESPAGLSPGEERELEPGRKGRSSAMIAFADHLIHPVLGECRRRGWRVPEDVALAGFAGIETFMAIPPWRILTTVRAPWQDLTRQAVALLARVIAREAVPPVTVLPVHLVAGETT
jgi:DNA-binding LacI/PurR family transcriptional regulator